MRFLVHWEGNNHLHRTVFAPIKALGKRVGVAINPATPAWSAGGNPARRRPGPGCDRPATGFRTSRPLIHTTLPDRRVRQMIGSKPGCDLEVDGGIIAQLHR